MIESVIFYWLITDFEEKALRVDYSEESFRARSCHNEAGVQAEVHFQRKLEPRGKNVFFPWNMDLRVGVTASKRRPATFSQFSFSRPPIWLLLSSVLLTS